MAKTRYSIPVPIFMVRALRTHGRHIVKNKIYKCYKETQTAYCIENKRKDIVYICKDFFVKVEDDSSENTKRRVR